MNEDALRRLIHHRTSIKIDLFVMGSPPVDEIQLARVAKRVFSTVADDRRFLARPSRQEGAAGARDPEQRRGPVHLRHGGDSKSSSRRSPSTRWREVVGSTCSSVAGSPRAAPTRLPATPAFAEQARKAGTAAKTDTLAKKMPTDRTEFPQSPQGIRARVYSTAAASSHSTRSARSTHRVTYRLAAVQLMVALAHQGSAPLCRVN